MIWLSILACTPTAPPDPVESFPYVYTPQTDLEPYEDVRWETETWSTSDPEMLARYIQKSVFHRPSAPEESLEHFHTMRERIPTLGAGIQLSFVGDVMRINQEDWATYALPAAPLLADADLRIGNLETPVSIDHSTEPLALGTYAFNAPPEMLDGLPLDGLQLNNNHSLDADDLGLENTLAEVDSRGLFHFGVDGQHTMPVGGLDVAFLGYTWGMNDGRTSAAGHELHIVPFGHIGREIDLALIEGQIADARDEADVVVLMLHWGFEYEYYPDPHFMVLARQLIAMGADLIVGHGPHVAQPPEICSVNYGVPGVGSCAVTTEDGRARTAAVLYSLGNFGTGMATLPCKVGLVGSASLDESGVTGLGWEAVYSAPGPEVLPLEPLRDDPELDEEALRLEAHLGRRWKRESLPE